MLDLLVLIALAALAALILGRGRLPDLGRGAGQALREYRRARAGLPPADPNIRPPDDSSGRPDR